MEHLPRQVRPRNDRIGLLHGAYRAGAVVDALVVVPLLVPQAAAAMLGLHSFYPGADYAYASGIAASLMIGWTGLLLWADRAPVPRRGVLPLTVLVLAGLLLAGLRAITDGLIEPGPLAPIAVVQVGLCLLFGLAYRRATALARPDLASAGSG
jgi:hypothetical protein